MKKIWCDLCGKELGTAVAVNGIRFNVGEPSFHQFIDEKGHRDICRECEKELTDTMHKAVEKRKKLRKVN